MLSLFFHAWERRLVAVTKDRLVRPFEWGLDWIDRNGHPENTPPETVLLGRAELSRGACAVTRRPYAFGVGFELQTELRTLGPPPNAFGHTGSGGSRHGAWPDSRVGFSFAMRTDGPLTSAC